MAVRDEMDPVEGIDADKQQSGQADEGPRPWGRPSADLLGRRLVPLFPRTPEEEDHAGHRGEQDELLDQRVEAAEVEHHAGDRVCDPVGGRGYTHQPATVRSFERSEVRQLPERGDEQRREGGGGARYDDGTYPPRHPSSSSCCSSGSSGSSASR
jgi:hypothetical protein